MLLYMLHLDRLSGDPLSFVHVQRDWSRRFILPPVAFWEGIGYALHPSRNPTVDIWGRGALNTAVALSFTGILLGLWRRLRPSYVLYGLATVLITVSSGMEGALVLHSLGRFLMLLFPVFIVLARWGRFRPVHLTIIVGFPMLLALNAILYVCWYSVA